jgi:methyltransferase (TIGR00027 family)
MRDGEPSLTARFVAAYRLGFEREPAPFGQPSADERLARDLAGELALPQSEPLARYLRGRTAFFDRVVTGALARGVPQIAVIGAGYDGRSLRYAKPGVRWFEVDHPATQADKRVRLDRSGIAVSHISFVALDLNDRGLDSALVRSGWDAGATSLVLCEGLAVYLGAAALEAMFADLRAIAGVGTRLAVSLPPPAPGPERLARGERLRAAIAALGEPARNALSAEETAEMLAATGWRPADVSERAQQAGFVLATPAMEPARAAQSQM